MVKEGIRSLVRLFVSQIWKPFKMWRALVLPNGLLFNDKHANDGQCAKLKDTNDIINAAGTFQICFSFTWKSFFFHCWILNTAEIRTKRFFLKEIYAFCVHQKNSAISDFLWTRTDIHCRKWVSTFVSWFTKIKPTSGSNQLQLHLIHSSVSSNLSADADQRQFLQRQASFIFCPRTDTGRKVTSVLLLGSSSIVNVIYTSLTVYLWYTYFDTWWCDDEHTAIWEHFVWKFSANDKDTVLTNRPRISTFNRAAKSINLRDPIMF